MALAFDLPQHLPRGGQPQDRSTNVLVKVGQATNTSLNADLASSWLDELDSTIHATKSRIHTRIYEDLPAFERQLKSSISIQTRLSDLSNNIDRLARSLNNAQTGILPTLLRTLSTHGALAEQANDSDIVYQALVHLLRIRDESQALSARVHNGELPECAQLCWRMQKLVVEAPSPLDRAEIMSDVKKSHRTFNNRVQEQLGDAYARSIMFFSSIDSISLMVLDSTTVPPTSTLITLPAILHSLASDSLSTRLSALRRDIMSKFVDPILLSSRSLTSSTAGASATLSLSSSSSSPLQSLQILTSFLDSYVFPHIPPGHAAFPSTFPNPITSAILNHLLKPSIPSSIVSLPSFLGTVDEAVAFEASLLPVDAKDRPIKQWADDLASHYERRRRESVLQRAREVVGKPENGETVRIEVTVRQLAASPSKGEGDTDESGWDFDGEDASEDESGSGLNGTHGDAALDRTNESQDEEDPSDGWGWGDDADPEEPSPSLTEEAPAAVSPLDENDDPWGNDGWDEPPAPAPPVPTSEPKPRVPKMAKRLEKFSVKAKGLSASSTPAASPEIASAPKPSPPPPAPHSMTNTPQPPLSPRKKQRADKETYIVSARAKILLELTQGLLREGQELMQSNVFASHTSAKPTAAGQLLLSAAPSVLDLHRALYPVLQSSTLAREPDLAMRWSNDCRFLSDEVDSLRSRGGFHSAEDRWTETGERLKVLGEVWFEDTIAREQEAVQSILVGAQGFVDVANEERFEECRCAVEQVLQEITSVGHQWKVTLTRSAYLNAMGQIVDDALFRVMDDVLSLEDIPEADSERLSDLCEMLTPLEKLFVDKAGEQSVVGRYVPLWFKFSYLSWLIKGSIADLSYLFDQGMLVDYEIDELVRLLRALFAETPLRENTIAKIVKGHPVHDQHDAP